MYNYVVSVICLTTLFFVNNKIEYLGKCVLIIILINAITIYLQFTVTFLHYT